MSVTKYLLIFSITLLLSFTAKADQGAIVTGSSVNIRQKPTTNSPVIGNVKKDMHLTAIERHTHSVVPRGEPSKWIKILLPVQADVWVKSSYLDQDLQVKAEQLNYRSGPGTNHEALGKIKKGTKVTFLETKDGWTKIKAPEPQYGFIAEKYITLTGKPPVTPEPPQASLSEDKATSQPDIKAEKKEEETKPVSEQKTTSDKNISAADIQVKAPAPVQMGNQTETNKTQITNEQETSPEDLAGMVAAEGIMTARGGMTSHAAVVARGMGKCCVAGCSEVIVDEENKVMKVGDLTFGEGDYISLNGTTGSVYAGMIKTVDPE